MFALLPLANSEWEATVFAAATVTACVAVILVVRHVRETRYPKTLYAKVKAFFGGRDDFGRALQIHDKSFPGYDLGSVNRALTSFLEDHCVSHESLGSVTFIGDLRGLLHAELQAYQKNQKPVPPNYQRLAVDVDEEESFLANCLFLCVLKPAAGAPPDAPPERAIILISTGQLQVDYEEEMDGQTTRPTVAELSIACRGKETADAFFNEIEDRRKRLSIYRGKVIDPVVVPGGIRSITFRRIHAVREQDLVLPETVKTLIRGAIVQFYDHRDVLRSLGVELKRGVLFHSPPGTGKTSISLYLAGLLPNFTVCFISGRRLMYPREVCAMARYLQPTMLVFEDIDLIAQERDQNGLATVLGELMNQIDGCEPNDQVLFIMNTNSLDRLEQAVRNRPGRVDQIVPIPLPDAAAREQLLRHFARGLRLPADVSAVIRATDGATPAVLKEVVKRAAVSAVARLDGAARRVEGAEAPQVNLDETDLLLANEQIQTMRNLPRADSVL